MTEEHIKGGKTIWDRLRETVQSDSVFHAYIVEGQNDAEKLLMAKNFVKAILCEEASGQPCEDCISCRKMNHDNHEDVIYIAKEGSSIKDEVVADMQSRLRKKPFAGERNIAIIENADTMTPKAQNRLLKTLEEPLGKNIIILLTENAGNLTQTINSRCILYRLPMNSAKPMTESLNEQYHLMEFAKGLAEKRSLYLHSKDLKEIGLKRETALEVLDVLENWFRDMLMLSYDASPIELVNTDRKSTLLLESRLYQKADMVNIIKSIEEAKDEMHKNINVSYALKSMLLKIQEDRNGKSSRNQI